MSDTKENILMTALRLFARDGYEAVSVSAIAGELGMTKGALYKHYRNKRDIFDSVVERMYRLDAERSQQYRMPQEPFRTAEEAYRDVACEHIRAFTAAQFVFWTEDEFACCFRRMLILEQYRDREMAELYRSCLSAGPLAYMEDIFREMMLRGALARTDPKALALTYYAPMFLLIQLSDGGMDRTEALALLHRHMDDFFQTYAVRDNQKGEFE